MSETSSFIGSDGTPGAVSIANRMPVSAGVTASPSSVLTRPANTTAYTANNLIASSTTAGSIVVPSVSIMRVAAGGGTLVRLLLTSSHTTGLSAVSVAVRLWSAAPTYTNGDGGAYAVATGAAGFIGKFTGTFEQYGDGAAAELSSVGGTAVPIRLSSGQVVYWDLQPTTGFTPQSGATFTLVAPILQD